MGYLQITNFLGLNTNTDPRRIEPNKDNAGVAEAVEMTNCDITQEGALTTATGYEKVSNIEGDGGIKNLLSYEKGVDERFLLITHADRHHYITPQNSVWEDLGSYGEEADLVGGVVYKGTGSLRRAILGTNNEENYPLAIHIGDQNVEIIQSKTTPYQYSEIDSAAKREGFAFNFSGNHIFKRLELRVRSVGTPGRVNAELYEADSSSDPTGPILASAESYISGASTNYGTMKFDFNYTVTEKDKEYVLILKPDAGDDASNYNLLLVTTGTPDEAANKYIRSTDSGATWSTASEEMYFVITQEATATLDEIDEPALKGSYIMEDFLGHLWMASGPNALYSGTENETVWGSTETGDAGLVGFNDSIRGFLNEGNSLKTFLRRFNQGVTFSFDDNEKLVIPQKDYKRQYGCLAPKTIQAVGANALYWSNRGVVSLGAEMNYNEVGVPRPMSLSKNIEPSLRGTNKLRRDAATAVNWENKQEYWLAVPYANSNVNNAVFVYNQTWKSWYVRSGFEVGDMEVFRDENYEDVLYYGSASSPYLYKFNDSYSYDGTGYTRRWKSKIFTFGTGIRFKKVPKIEFAGSMDQATKFKITIRTDNRKKTYEIDNTFLIKDSFSNYIGDNWLGDAYYGGSAPEDSRFKRFYAPLDLPADLREGIEFQITIENDGEEEPWKIDHVGITYDVLSSKQVPRRAYVNKQIST